MQKIRDSTESKSGQNCLKFELHNIRVFRLLKHASRAHGALSYPYHHDNIHEHFQEALSNSYGQDGAV